MLVLNTQNTTIACELVRWYMYNIYKYIQVYQWQEAAAGAEVNCWENGPRESSLKNISNGTRQGKVIYRSVEALYGQRRRPV